ncbi:hypothetical protein CsSME_00054184 [Camellia sinensis var. sinensis]
MAMPVLVSLDNKQSQSMRMRMRMTLRVDALLLLGVLSLGRRGAFNQSQLALQSGMKHF